MLDNQLTRIQMSVAAEDRYKFFLKVVSTSMNITLSELEVNILDLLHTLGGEITSGARQKMCDSLVSYDKNKKEKPMSAFNLNNYLLKLRTKKVIVEDRLIPLLDITIPEVDLFFIQFEISVK